MSKSKLDLPSPISANRVVITSFLVDVSDVVINSAVAILTGSVVIRAEFLQGLADMIGSALLIVGVKRSKKIADRKHPFGFGKEIYFWTLLSAIMMVSLASSFSIYFGLDRIKNPQAIDNPLLALTVLMLAATTNGYAASLSFRRLLGKKELRLFFKSFGQTPLV